MNDLFDCFNFYGYKENREDISPYKLPITKESPHLEFLKKAELAVSTMKYITKVMRT